MEQAWKYILVLLIIFGGFYVKKLINNDKIIPLTEKAIDPDIHFSNSRTYFKEKDFGRGVDHLIRAIRDIHNIERDLDPASNKLLEESIVDLEIVKRELENDSLVIKDLNISYSEALNALTEAEIKVTKALLKSDHRHDAMVALKYGMTHLKNTLKYTEGKKKAKEIAIYTELDEVLESTSLTDKEIMERLDHIIEELDSLHSDNLHSDIKD